jgi:type IX secretion system PorP/SprF family membrane protein
MKKIFTLFSLLLLCEYISAQQLSRTQLFVVNPYFLNPAAAGPTRDIDLFVNYRRQWASQIAPQTFTFVGSKMFVNGLAGGVQFTKDQTGAYSTTGIEFTGAYHVNMNRNQAISFGLSLVGKQHVFDPSGIQVIDPNDQVLNSGVRQSSFVPNASAGILLSSKTYYVGISASQLFETPFKLGQNPTQQKEFGHFSIHTAWTLPIGSKNGANSVHLTPNAQLKWVRNGQLQGVFGIMADIDNQVYFGISSDIQSACTSIVGLKWDQYRIWYAYDFNVKASNTLGSGAHEICFSYLIPRGRSGQFRSGQIKKSSLRL